MILGPRCNGMLANHCQCPLAAVEGSKYCKLHIATVEEKQSQPTPTAKLNLLYREKKAPLSNKD